MEPVSIGDKVTFRTYDGRLITGKILAIIAYHVYLVLGDDSICTMYNDGLYRFTSREIVCSS